MLSQMSSKWSSTKCGPKFHSNDNLCYHRKEIHSKEIKCKTCSKVFENNWKLENHITKHHKPKRIKCDKCDQTLYSKWRLSKHMKMHQPEANIRTCHFYNNGKVCPFQEFGCKFRHIDASLCTFGETCRRDRCQFKHH